jgi:hypothetical protein
MDGDEDESSYAKLGLHFDADMHFSVPCLR